MRERLASVGLDLGGSGKLMVAAFRRAGAWRLKVDGGAAARVSRFGSERENEREIKRKRKMREEREIIFFFII